MPDRPGARRGRRRHWRRLVPCWWSAVVLVTGGGIAAAQPPDDTLPDEIGPGWEVAAADFCQLGPPWVVRCFSGPSGIVLVAAAPVVMDARFEAQFFASGFNAAAEPSPGVSRMPGGCRQGSPTARAPTSSPASSTSSWSPTFRSIDQQSPTMPSSSPLRGISRPEAAALRRHRRRATCLPRLRRSWWRTRRPVTVPRPRSGSSRMPIATTCRCPTGYGSCSNGRAGPSCARSPTAQSSSWCGFPSSRTSTSRPPSWGPSRAQSGSTR